MRLLDSLASAFISTFGITQPSEQMRQRMSWFILGMLVFALLIVSGLGFLFYHLMH